MLLLQQDNTAPLAQCVRLGRHPPLPSERVEILVMIIGRGPNPLCHAHASAHRPIDRLMVMKGGGPQEATAMQPARKTRTASPPEARESWILSSVRATARHLKHLDNTHYYPDLHRCQGRGRGFESLRPLQLFSSQYDSRFAPQGPLPFGGQPSGPQRRTGTPCRMRPLSNSFKNLQSAQRTRCQP